MENGGSGVCPLVSCCHQLALTRRIEAPRWVSPILRATNSGTLVDYMVALHADKYSLSQFTVENTVAKVKQSPVEPLGNALLTLHWTEHIQYVLQDRKLYS